MPAHRLWMKSGASGRAIDLDNTSIHDDEDADAEHPRDNPHQGALEPKPKQRADVHLHQRLLHIAHQRGHIQGRIADDDAGSLIDNMLRHIKNGHHDIPCVGYDEYCAERFENPLEENERLKVMEVVAVNQQLNQFQAHHERQDDSRDGDNDIL